MSGDIVQFPTEKVILPHNDEAEQSLLGAIFLKNKVFYDVGDIVKAEHFFNAVHGRIFAAIEALLLAGKAATPVTLKGVFENDGALADVGGPRYLSRLAASAVLLTTARDYAQTILECWKRRRLIEVSWRLSEMAADETLDSTSEQAIYEAEEAFLGLDASDNAGLVPLSVSIAEAVSEAEAGFKAGGHLRGLSTGLLDIDSALGGLHKTDLIIIAGRPSMGKSALAAGIAVHAARDGTPVAFASLEMSSMQLAQRAMASETGVSADRQRRGDIDANDMAELIETSRSMKDLPLYIDQTGGISVNQLRSRAIRLKRRYGLGLIVVDYLQLMVGGKTENRTQEVSRITRDLKLLAKDLNVPVIALSQLSREVERREDKRPQLSDLRESGSIEQDADVVMFCFREEYYLDKSEPQEADFEDYEKYHKKWLSWTERQTASRGIAEILIRKNRHGPCPTVRLRFDGVRTKFENLARGA